ncbi:MAG TPA: hypothetical protein VFQ85_14570 [Mycobacteriales bacterium]|jgi:hypothetical protein|nr:hypothetical protein [Mycobacteriales bacterium]
MARTYPPEAYAPDGTLWWRLTHHPGQKREYGDELKLAAWLAFNIPEGGRFTMRDLRRALGSAVGRPNDAEHLNRRLRNLRPDGWVIDSGLSNADVPSDAYELKRIGWHPGLGTRRPPRRGVSSRLARVVIERDRRRCVVCGVGGGEPYPAAPHTPAVLTAGHRVPAMRATRASSADELQAECLRCNGSVRDTLPDPPTLPEVLPAVARLSRAERLMLLRWLTAGHRLRSQLDDVHDQIRMLSPDEQAQVVHTLRMMLGTYAEGLDA